LQRRKPDTTSVADKEPEVGLTPTPHLNPPPARGGFRWGVQNRRFYRTEVYPELRLRKKPPALSGKAYMQKVRKKMFNFSKKLNISNAPYPALPPPGGGLGWGK
jgi:hypothetical protein